MTTRSIFLSSPVRQERGTTILLSPRTPTPAAPSQCDVGRGGTRTVRKTLMAVHREKRRRPVSYVWNSSLPLRSLSCGVRLGRDRGRTDRTPCSARKPGVRARPLPVSQTVRGRLDEGEKSLGGEVGAHRTKAGEARSRNRRQAGGRRGDGSYMNCSGSAWGFRKSGDRLALGLECPGGQGGRAILPSRPPVA